MDYTFDVSNEYILENNCVLLRPLRGDDCENLRIFAEQEPALWTYSSQKADSLAHLQRYIQTAMQAREEGKEYSFIVFDKRTGQYAGSTRFYDIQLYHRTVLLGYTWYGKAFQGTGLNRHCKFLLLQFAFERMGMERVEFRADIENVRSIAAMKAIGCREEGILRSHMLKDEGSRRDSIILSILRSEWEQDVREKLAAQLS